MCACGGRARRPTGCAFCRPPWPNLTGNDLMDILFALSEADMPQAFHTASLSLLPGEEYALNPADVQAYREALYGKEEKQ